ncbi:hypothetical protein QCD79_33555, partial [Pseudomonas quasicaspiana]|nr:hypothetical protein [Pseudomonas quasicaspiana]
VKQLPASALRFMPTLFILIQAHCCISDFGGAACNAAEIADAAVRLYQDEERWHEAQSAGWELLDARYRHQKH